MQVTNYEPESTKQIGTQSLANLWSIQWQIMFTAKSQQKVIALVFQIKILKKKKLRTNLSRNSQMRRI